MNPVIKKLMPAVLGIAVLALASAHGQFIVNSTGDADRWPVPLAACETDPFTPGDQCTLRAAIQTANLSPDSSTISFNIPTTDPGYNPQTGSYTINFQSALPDISTDMTISGPGAEKLTVMRSRATGTPSFRIFNVTTSGAVTVPPIKHVATFSGLTIRDGAENESGGGIQNANDGTVNIKNCALINNYSNDKGGAIFNAQSGRVNVTNSTLKFNTAYGEGGGGIFNVAGFINVSNSEFVNNTAGAFYPAAGGGIASAGGVVSVSGSTFFQNIGRSAGGGIAGAGTLTVTNSTFYANMVYNFGVGGAIYNSGTLNLSNCTLTGNFSDYQGSGVYNENGKIANVKSTIIAANYGGVFLMSLYPTFQIGEAPDVFGVFNSHGFNLIGKKDGSTSLPATTDQKGTLAAPLDPKLDPKGLRNNGGSTRTVALQRGSPAIDKGTSASLAGTLATDQRGFPRTVNNPAIANATGGDGTDIGAFELPAP